MQLNSHVIFNGQCEDAFKFYEACLGGEIVGMWRHAETPGENHVLGESHNQVIHATLDLDGDLLQGCDVPSDHYQKPQGFSVKLDLKDTAEAERIFPPHRKIRLPASAGDRVRPDAAAHRSLLAARNSGKHDGGGGPR